MAHRAEYKGYNIRKSMDQNDKEFDAQGPVVILFNKLNGPDGRIDYKNLQFDGAAPIIGPFKDFNESLAYAAARWPIEHPLRAAAYHVGLSTPYTPITRSTMPSSKYNLELPDAIVELERLQEDLASSHGELKEVDADTAFSLGYATAIYDLKRITSPSQLEIEAVEIEVILPTEAEQEQA